MQIYKKLGLGPRKGDVGIEIEVEGTNLPKDGLLHWRVEKDGSLRGNSAEYVLKEPLTLEGANAALHELSEAYLARNTVVRDSVRTGVHVHVNVQRLEFNQLFNFAACYMLVEKSLIRWCGDARVGNLFCLSSCEAEALMLYLRESINKRDLNILHTDEIRYSSINFKAVREYGSVEFRSMAGTGDLQRILHWASLLVHLRDFSMRFENPLEVVDLCLRDPIAFEEEMMGKWRQIFGVRCICEEGIRQVNDLAHLSNWQEVKYRDIGGLMFPDNIDFPDEPLEDF